MQHTGIDSDGVTSSPRPRLLVAYETAHGSTRGVAQEIGRRLSAAGLSVEVRPVAEVDRLEPYDAVVLGSAIQDGHWLPGAAAFATNRAGELAARATWLFSVSSLGETTSFFGPRLARFLRGLRKDGSQLASLRQTTRARGHRHFAGSVEPKHWNWVGRGFIRLSRGRYGDHRDWADIAAWADDIGRDVLASR